MYPAIEDQLKAIRRDATYSERLQAWRLIEKHPTTKKTEDTYARVVSLWWFVTTGSTAPANGR